MTMSRHVSHLLVVAVAISLCTNAPGQSFTGFDSTTLEPVTDTAGDWGLRIMVLDVGQADAILVFAPNGDVCLIDSGDSNSDGSLIFHMLDTPGINGIGQLRTIDLLYTTHYDKDHIAGITRLLEHDVSIRKAFDQGLSQKRSITTPSGIVSFYGKYVKAVGDPNDNLFQDVDESDFVRHRMDYGHVERIGLEDQVEIRCVAVRGDTEGNAEDLSLDPSTGGNSFDENPGSIAILIRLGEFEFYTAGDQTDNDWKSKPAVEESILNSGAIPGGNDIDVLKVSHHGSDTSTSDALAEELDAEVAIISTKLTSHGLPKKIVLKQFQENRCFVLITGDGMTDDGDYTESGATAEDDGFDVSDTAVFNNQGNVTVLVSADGGRYTVRSGSFSRTFSAIDTDNQR